MELEIRIEIEIKIQDILIEMEMEKEDTERECEFNLEQQSFYCRNSATSDKKINKWKLVSSQQPATLFHVFFKFFAFLR